MRLRLRAGCGDVHRSTVLRTDLAGTTFFFSYDRETDFRLRLVSVLLGFGPLSKGWIKQP